MIGLLGGRAAARRHGPTPAGDGGKFHFGNAVGGNQASEATVFTTINPIALYSIYHTAINHCAWPGLDFLDNSPFWQTALITYGAVGAISLCLSQIQDAD